jgi:hypothetical protein
MKQLIAALALAFALTGATFAQEAEGDPSAEESSPEDRETSFQNVTGPQVEDVPGGALLIGAYGVAWFLVVAYLWRLAALSRRTAADVDALHHAVRNATEDI